MCPEESGATGLGELRSWWEVPAIAHFCSLFRTAFRLPDFEIEVSSRRCALFLRASLRGVAGRRLGAECGRRGARRRARGWRPARAPRGPSRSRRRGSSLLLSARDPGVLPGLLGWPEGESARALPPGASEVASSCSGGDRDGMRAQAPGATAAGRERPWAGAALLWRRSPRSHLADLRRPVTLKRFESTSGGRRWGLGLGRSPCGTARRSGRRGCGGKVWGSLLLKNTSSSELRAAFRIRGVLSSS